MSLRWGALVLLVVLIGASALAFGSVEDWAGECLRLGVLLVAAALLASGVGRRSLGRPTHALLGAVVVVVAVGSIQSIPVPSFVIRALSPRWAHLRDQVVSGNGSEALPRFLAAEAIAHGASIQPGESLPRVAPATAPVQGGRSLSVAPQATRRAILAWITAGLGLACAAALARRPGDLYVLLWALASWSGALGVIAILTRISGTTKLLGFRQAPDGVEFLGPFVDPNHFAGFVEIGLLVAFGLVLALVSEADGRVTRASVRKCVLDREWALPRLVVLGGCAVAGLIGLVLSSSRAGWVAFAIGFLALLAARRLKHGFALIVVAVVSVGLAVGIVSWVGGSDGRLGGTPFAVTSADPSFAMRWDMWGRTLKIIGDFPAVGTGLGTFRYAYAVYDRPGEWLRTDQAHNDYLQLIAETGVTGAMALAWAVIVLVRRVLLPIARNATRFRWTTAACSSAVLATLIHTVFDFGLQIPAVAFEFAVTLGILTAIATGVSEPAPESQG